MASMPSSCMMNRSKPNSTPSPSLLYEHMGSEYIA
jgi:hypothetical protein